MIRSTGQDKQGQCAKVAIRPAPLWQGYQFENEIDADREQDEFVEVAQHRDEVRYQVDKQAQCNFSVGAIPALILLDSAPYPSQYGRQNLRNTQEPNGLNASGKVREWPTNCTSYVRIATR